jgi:endopeptidase La
MAWTKRFIYDRYLTVLLGFEKHVLRIYRNWVIDLGERNRLLRRITLMVQMLQSLPNGHQDGRPMFFDFLGQVWEKYWWQICQIEGFPVIPQELWDLHIRIVRLLKRYGFWSILDFLNFYTDGPQALYPEDWCALLFYQKIFVPLEISIRRIHGEHKPLSLHRSPRISDSLIYNSCQLSFDLRTGVRLKMVGYLDLEILHIFSEQSSHTKKECRQKLLAKQPEMTRFLKKYYHYRPDSLFIIYSPDELCHKIARDYQTFLSITSKSFNLIMKQFVHANIKGMFDLINLLLMGNDQNVYTATLLFNLLHDKKVNNDSLGNVLYHHLPLAAQFRIRRAGNELKHEIARVRTLNPDTISIEKKLATMVNLPDNVRAYILEKMDELRTGENNHKIQMAINALFQFPWKPKNYEHEYYTIRKSPTSSRRYLANVAQKLNENVYGHEESKRVLLELVGKWIQNPESSGQVIGLQGPPGIGKTLLAKSISNALGIPLVIIGLGGLNDSADLIGHSFTYAGAQYGMIVRQMIRAGSWRCIMLFDEADKVSKRNETNEIYNTLIHVTDPNMNQHFQDRFFSSSIEFDLSGVLIVFSYNDSSKIDPILFDRIKEIRMTAYTPQEKLIISQKYIIPEICHNIGLDHSKIQIDGQVISYIIEKYTLEAGVRDLYRRLEQIMLRLNIDHFYLRGPFRGIIRRFYKDPPDDKSEDHLSEDRFEDFIRPHPDPLEAHLNTSQRMCIYRMEYPIQITRALVHHYLKKPIIPIEHIQADHMIGVINGLYASPLGVGGIISIQIYPNRIGSRNGSSEDPVFRLKLTGNQKKIMRESAACALTVAVNMVHPRIRRRLEERFPYGFHIHVPDGGTPKDGPSAGCAFAIAFLSIILNHRINQYVALTGEIELTGKISKIGGLDIKLDGAKRAGVRIVYISRENQEDYDEIRRKNSSLFDRNFRIKCVDHLIEIAVNPKVLLGAREDEFDPIYLEKLKR